MKYTLIIAKWLCLLLWLLAANSLLAQNMGIGTRAPQEKLHVAGRLRVDSLQGTGIGIVVVLPNGTLQRLSQPTDPSQVLRGDLSWGPVAGLTGGTVTNIQTGLGLTGGPITTAGTIGIIPGTAAGDVLQWNGSNWQPVQLANQLPAAATVGDVLTWNGTNWVNRQPGDPVVGNEVTDATVGGFLKRSGAGTPADPYTLGLENGINPGDVIKWTGTGWAPAKDSVGLTSFTEKDSVVGDEVKRVIDNRGLEITGAGTAADPLAVGLIAGTAAGQYLVWDGVRWTPQTLTFPTFTEKDAIIGNEITDRTDANSGLEVVGAGTDTDPKKIRIIPGAAGNPGVLTWNGTGWSVQSPSLTAVQAAAGSPITVTGTGAAATPYQIGLQSGTAANQALVWSGTGWVPATFQVVGAQGVTVTATGTAPAPINFTVGLPIGSTLNNTLVWNTVTSQWEAGPAPAPPSALPPGAANQFLIHNGITWSGQPFAANGSNGITVTGAGTTASPLNISLPAGAANQALIWNGAAWAPSNLAANGTAPINVTGAGTTASPFVVSLAAGTAAGHVLTWNGANWVSQAPPGAAYTGTAPVNVTGTNISLNAGTAANQALIWNGAAWAPSNLAANGTAPINVTGAGTTASPFVVSLAAGLAAGHVLTWNGTAWVSQAPTGATYTGTAPVNVTGTNISLNAGTAANQALIWNGAAWAPSNLAANGTAPINVTGAGTTASPFVVSLAPGMAAGEVLTWNGTAWFPAMPPGNFWSLTGNAGTTPATNFIGTTDAQDLVFRTNNIERMRVTPGGNVGINFPTPFNRLHVVEGTNTTAGSAAIFGNNTTATANAVHGVYGLTSSTSGVGAGVFGINANTGAGVRGENSNLNGTGVFALGASSSATGTGAALTAFNNNAAAGLGALILGNNIAAPVYPTINPAVLSPFRNPGTGSQGGAALIANGQRLGVYGTAVSTNPVDQNITGVFGEATSQVGTTGVLGLGTGGGLINNTLFGIYGVTPTKTNFGMYASADSFGILAINTNDNASHGFGGAVTGLCFNPGTAPNFQGTGVVGWGDIGVTGISAGSGLGGVVGFCDPTVDLGGIIGVAGAPTDIAIFGIGDIAVTGPKLFKIDHPLDPENKYLNHFAIESNEVLNVYRGNITLDANGEATVTLPHYFHAVNNTNCSYHLTPIGDFANLYIKEKLNGLQFKIAGGKPNMEVSWILYTERNDPLLQQYPEKRKVEVEKVGRAKGKYLTPELFGQPQEKAIIRRPAKLDKEAARKAFLESVKNSGNVSKEPLPQK